MLFYLVSQCIDITINKPPKWKMTFYVPCGQEESICFPLLPKNNGNICLWTLDFALAHAFYCSRMIPLVYIFVPTNRLNFLIM